MIKENKISSNSNQNEEVKELIKECLESEKKHKKGIYNDNPIFLWGGGGVKS